LRAHWRAANPLGPPAGAEVSAKMQHNLE